jgi:hypothetical protein
LNDKYNDRWNLQVGAVIAIAVIALITVAAIVQRILFFLIKPESAVAIAIFAGIGVSCICGIILFKYFSKSNLFGLSTILNDGNEELAIYDKQIRHLEKKIQENYQIANS